MTARTAYTRTVCWSVPKTRQTMEDVKQNTNVIRHPSSKTFKESNEKHQ